MKELQTWTAGSTGCLDFQPAEQVIEPKATVAFLPILSDGIGEGGERIIPNAGASILRS